MVRQVSTREVALTLAFKLLWCDQEHSQKSSRICDQLVVNFEPCLQSLVAANSRLVNQAIGGKGHHSMNFKCYIRKFYLHVLIPVASRP